MTTYLLPGSKVIIERTVQGRPQTIIDTVEWSGHRDMPRFLALRLTKFGPCGLNLQKGDTIRNP